MTTLRTLLALVLLPAVAACDSAGPDDGPDPGPANASISIALGDVTANSNCDSATNPGDFQFLIEISDLGNNTIESVTLPNGATYGTDSGDVVRLFAGDRQAVGQTVSVQQPRAEGSGFAVALSGMEWESPTARDSRMDDRTSTRTHPFSDGQFGGVVGTRQLTVGSSGCTATLDYMVTVQ